MKEKKKSIQYIKLGVFVLLCILVVVCHFVEPFEGLDAAGMQYLGIFVWWIGTVIIGIIPAHYAALLGCVMCMGFGLCSISQAFAAFSSSTVWLLVGSLGLAGALANSGLLKRMAINIMKLFPVTYSGQVTGMATASVAIAPFIPSTIAKCAILVPLAGNIGDEFGFKPHSKGTVGLFLVTMIITNFAGVMFLTGGGIVPQMLGICGVNISWIEWLKVFVIWGIAMVVLTVIYTLVFYNPKKTGDIIKSDKNSVKKRAEELGPMSKKEKLALAVLILTVLVWVTEGRLHAIPTCATAIAAWIILAMGGLFSAADLSTKMGWSTFLLVGSAMSLVSVLSTLGVSTWMGTLVAPVINLFADKSALLLIVVWLVATVLNLGMVASLVSAAIIVPMLAGCSISPLILTFVMFLAARVFVLSFAQSTVLAAVGVSGDRIEHKDIVPGAWAYIVINFAAMLISMPWWSLLGLM